jgi:hypothetical protein
MSQEETGLLQDWILVEAYKNGLARRNSEDSCGESGAEEPGGFYIHRHDIYERYFKLPTESLLYGAEAKGARSDYRTIRLKSAVLLCASVRHLLRHGLIRFPPGRISKADQVDLLRTYSSSIVLTDAGVMKAESLLAASPEPDERDADDGRCRP